MKKILTISILLLGVASIQNTYADELNDIAEFVKSVCDEVSTKGKRKITKTDLEASVGGNIGKIAKYLGVEVAADGKVKRSDTQEEYDGIPYESLSEQMTDSRSCKRALSKQLIEARKATTSKLENLFNDDLQIVAWPDKTPRTKFVVGTTTMRPSCPEDSGNKKNIIKIKIDGSKVDLKVNRLKFDAKLSSDRKTIIASAQVREDGGITTFNNTEITLRSDGEIEGELPWLWRDQYGNTCSGIDVITDINKMAST